MTRGSGTDGRGRIRRLVACFRRFGRPVHTWRLGSPQGQILIGRKIEDEARERLVCLAGSGLWGFCCVVGVTCCYRQSIPR